MSEITFGLKINLGSDKDNRSKRGDYSGLKNNRLRDAMKICIATISNKSNMMHKDTNIYVYL